MRLLLQAKGVGCVILVSDGVSATGMPDGRYMLGNFQVTVANGVCRNAEGKLAGSTLTFNRALAEHRRSGHLFVDAVRMLTANPAKLFSPEYKKGALRASADADIVLRMIGFTSLKFGPVDILARLGSFSRLIL